MYYFYISGRILKNNEIDDLKGKNSNRLIAYKPAKQYNKIDINNTFIVFRSMLQRIEEYYSEKDELVKDIINLYEKPITDIKWTKQNGLYYVLRLLRKNRYQILPTGKVIDILHFFYELDNFYKNNQKANWQILADQVVSETTTMLANIKNKKEDKNFTSYGACRQNIGKIATPINIAGNLLGYDFIKKNKDALKSKSIKTLSKLFEDYFYNLHEKDLIRLSSLITDKINDIYDFDEDESERNESEKIYGQVYNYIINIAHRLPDIGSVMDLYYSQGVSSVSANVVRDKKGKILCALSENENKTEFVLSKYNKDGSLQKDSSEKFTFDLSVHNFKTQDGTALFISSLFQFYVDIAEKSIMPRSQRFKFVVDNVTFHCNGLRFADKMHLSYSYAAVMFNLAEHFKYNLKRKFDDKIKRPYDVRYIGIRYGYEPPYSYIDHKFNYINKVDCITSTVIALNILGIPDKKYKNINDYSPELKGPYTFDKDLWLSTGDKPEYKEEKIILYIGFQAYETGKSCRIQTGQRINGVKNLMANDIYTRYFSHPDIPYGKPDQPKNPKDAVSEDLGNDFTGIVGVKRATMKLRDNASINFGKEYYSNEFEGHFYTFFNNDGSEISHSSGGRGLRRNKVSSYYINSTYWCLRLIVPKNRML
jgi:hypothetical protein